MHRLPCTTVSLGFLWADHAAAAIQRHESWPAVMIHRQAAASQFGRGTAGSAQAVYGMLPSRSSLSSRSGCCATVVVWRVGALKESFVAAAKQLTAGAYGWRRQGRLIWYQPPSVHLISASLFAVCMHYCSPAVADTSTAVAHKQPWLQVYRHSLRTGFLAPSVTPVAGS